MGLGLTVVVGVGLLFGDRIFTKDVEVLHLISIGVPVSIIINYLLLLHAIYKLHIYVPKLLDRTSHPPRI